MAYGDYTPLAPPTGIPDELVLTHWARQMYKAGIDESYFKRFMGHDSDAIVHVKEELNKGSGDSIIIPLAMPLVGAGVVDDDKLEGNEEAQGFRDFRVEIHQIRHATILKGEYEEKKTQINLRREAQTAIKNWLARYIDLAIFSVLTGTKFPLLKKTTDRFPFPVEPPTADRVMFAGGKTTENAITAADVFTADLISQAKRKAIEDEVTAIRPVRVDGRETYVMLIDHWQARDLKADPKFYEAQQFANVRGNKNPIFTGALGVYDGVVIHENGRVPRTTSGAGSTLGSDGYYTGGVPVGHAVLLGAQAVTFAEGRAPKTVVKYFDYDNEWSVAIGRMLGLKRSMFKYDDVNWTDFGCLNIMTSSTKDPTV